MNYSLQIPNFDGTDSEKKQRRSRNGRKHSDAHTLYNNALHTHVVTCRDDGTETHLMTNCHLSLIPDITWQASVMRDCKSGGDDIDSPGLDVPRVKP